MSLPVMVTALCGDPHGGPATASWRGLGLSPTHGPGALECSGLLVPSIEHWVFSPLEVAGEPRMLGGSLRGWNQLV